MLFSVSNMFYTVFLFILFPVYSFQWTCLNRISGDPIHIIKVKASYENEINKKTIEILNSLSDVMYEKCQQHYNMEILEVSDLYHSAKATTTMIQNGRSFINLFGHERLDLELNKDEIINAGFVYYDNIDEPLKFKLNETYTAYVTNFNSSIDCECDGGDSTNCCDKPWTTEVFENNPLAAKIMSKNLYDMNSGDLFEFVTKLDFYKDHIQFRESCLSIAPSPNELNTVYVYSDDLLAKDLEEYLKYFCFSHITVKIKSTEIIRDCKSNEKCENEIDELRKNSIAVLAPKPFEIGIELTVPIIFFNSATYSEDISQFPNSINLFNGDVIKYGFMRLIRNMGWRRVAILSDDAPYSVSFENEMIQLFQNEGIIYNVQRCESEYCNFKKALRNLQAVNARIIIVNVVETNVAKIIDETRKYKMFTLIYRVWSSEISSRLDLDSSKSFFINLKPRTVSDIKRTLDTIENTVHQLRTMHDLDIVPRKDFFRQFVTAMKRKIKAYEETLSVRYENNKLISEFFISKNGAVYEKKYLPLPINKRDQPDCIFESNKFDSLCDHFTFVYLIFVIVLFFVLLLVVTCYFHNTSPIHAANYTQF